MKIHIFDLESHYLESKDSALLPIDEVDNNLAIDIWGAVGERVEIDIKTAELNEVVIDRFEIKISNGIELKFLAKKFAIKIKELIFKCGGINYIGGAIIDRLSIFTFRPQVSIDSHSIDNIFIKTVPHDDEEPIRQLLSGIEVIPGCGEFIYDPSHYDVVRSTAELKTALPKMKWVAPVVAWFADNLDIEKCKIKPGIDRNYGSELDGWQVSGYLKNSAHIISLDKDNNSVYGGSINDNSIVKYLKFLKENELKIIFYPLIMVDIKGKPWRGKIGASTNDQDKIKSASHIENFFTNQYKPFILHYANLLKNKIDAFIIGSELVGLTSIYDQNKNFPFILKLLELAGEVKQILGNNVKITYAADWSEYHSTNGGLRPLDDLWSSPNIDFVGIDAYFPITDLKNSRISAEKIKEGWHGGEGYDYYYSDGNKIPFKDDEPWTQWKNLSYWWHSEHWAWDNEKQKSIKTSWQPKSKPIWFTEFGFPSIDKAPNKPNVFYDPKSCEGGIPSHSSGRADDAIQLRAIRASLEFWQNSEFLEQMILWTWDARGIGWQKELQKYADGNLWEYGHWLDGKIAYRHLELSGCIKKAKKLVIEAESLNTYASLEVEEILVEVQQNIDINNKIHINIVAFLKCNDLSIKADISGKALFVNALSTNLNNNIGSLELLNIQGREFNIKQVDLKIAHIFVSITGNLNIAALSIDDIRSDTHDGGKTRTIIDNQVISKHIITAIYAEFNIGGNFNIPPISLDIENLLINANHLSLDVTTTDHKHTIIFTGARDWKGDNQEWEQVTFVQTAHVVEINSNIINIKVENNFASTASKIKANSISMEARQYSFQGKILDNYVTKDGHTKSGIFIPEKSFNEEHRHASIEGVKVVVAGTAYMIAHGQIWLQASGISADQLIVKAPKIILDSIVGSNYHSMSVTKQGVRLALTFNTREISGGIEAYQERAITQQQQQFLAPSLLQGRTVLDIEADNLHQHGSLLSGRTGRITANSWTASAPTLIQSYLQSHSRTALSATIGIKQNVSEAIEGLQNTSQAISNYDSNNSFAALNIISYIHGNFRSLTNLAAGNLVNAGVWLGANMSTNTTRSLHITHALSQADFEELEAKISGQVSGTLEINANRESINASRINLEHPVDEYHHSHRQTNINASTSGASASHYQEKNGAGFGAGYSTAIGSRPRPFGPEITVQYTSGNDRLNVTYASMDREQVAAAWEGGLEGIARRAVANIANETGTLYDLASNPANIIGDASRQLSDAYEAISSRMVDIFGSSSTTSTSTTSTSSYAANDDNILNDDAATDRSVTKAKTKSKETKEERARSQQNWEEQLDKVETKHQKELKTLITKLEQELPNLTGLKQEFTRNLVEEYKAMLARDREAVSLNDVVNKVKARHNNVSNDDLTGSLRASLDLVGSTLGYADQQLSNFSDRYLTKYKSTIEAGLTMATDRVGEGIYYIAEKTIGQEGIEQVSEYAVKTIKWGEKNLNPGEQELLIKAAQLMLKLPGKKLIKVPGQIKGKLKVNEEVLTKIEAKLAKNTTHQVGNIVEEAAFMGARGESAVKIFTKHRSMTENHVKNLVSHGTIKLADNISVEHQVAKLTDHYQKAFLKYQKYNITEGKEWKMKIIGKPQKTGTEGHARAMAQLAMKYAKDPEVDFVFMDQGLKKATGASLKSNIRPDTIIVSRGGKIDLIKVASKTDKKHLLEERILEGMESLPRSMQGSIDVRDPIKIIREGD